MTAPADLHPNHRSLEGRRAIITGGTTGIGRAIAVLLAAGGAR
ncbi:MAG: short-chain dehydrogenase, partial [Sphingomonas sp.]